MCTVISHVIAARTAGKTDALATGLAASAQLGLPAAAASLGLAAHVLDPATAAALVAAGCMTLVPATIGGRMLLLSATARGTPPVASAAEPGG